MRAGDEINGDDDEIGADGLVAATAGMSTGHHTPQEGRTEHHTPQEYTMPNTLREYVLRSNFTWPITGAIFGTFIVLARAFITTKSLDDTFELSKFIFKHGDIIKRYPAYGAMAGLAMANVMMPLFYKALQYRRARVTQINSQDPEEEYERVRHPLLPSPSVFSPFDARVFLGAQAFSLLGVAYLSQRTSSFVGDVFGPAIGVLGAVLAVVLDPAIARKIRWHWGRLGQDTVQEIESRHSYKESRHDVRLCDRLFFGAFIGAALTYIVEDNHYSRSFLYTQWVRTLVSALFVGVVPLLWASLRKGIIDFRRDEPQQGVDHRAFYMPSWNLPSQLDLASYINVMAGAMTSVTFKLSIQACVGAGKSVGHCGYWLAMAFLPLLRPMVYAHASKIISYPESIEVPTPPRLGIDMPLEHRAMFASLAGMMMGAAVAYLKSIKAATALPLVGACVMTCLATLGPMIEQKFIEYAPAKIRDAFNLALPDEDDEADKADLNMPFYTRMLVGAWAFANIAVAFGSLFPNLFSKKVVPGFIGPRFMRVSNDPGAAIGTLVGAAFGLLWPLIVWAGKQAAEKASEVYESSSLQGRVEGCLGWLSNVCSGDGAAGDPEEQRSLLRGGGSNDAGDGDNDDGYTSLLYGGGDTGTG